MFNWALFFCLLLWDRFFLASSTCKYSTGGRTFDLSNIEGDEVEAVDTKFTYTLTVCKNAQTCNGASAMVVQTNQNQQCAANLASYSPSDFPDYSSTDGGTWTFFFIRTTFK